MPIFESAWDVFNSIFLLLIGIFVVLGLRRNFSLGSRRVLALYAWHTLWSLIYCAYTLSNEGDALGYYNQALEHDFSFEFGTTAITFITAFLVHGLSISYIGCFMFFNILGCIGLMAFDASMKRAVEGKSRKLERLATLIVFLPSVSFWSSAIGKDSIAFMATGLALWAAIDLKRRSMLVAFSIICMLLVRPHVAGIMVLALGLGVLGGTHVSRLKKFFISTATFGSIAILVPMAINYSGLDASSMADVETYIETRQGFNMEGGGGVDISSMSLPMQLFTYMFRPFFIDANSVFQIAASLDNLILLILFLAGGWRMLCRVRSNLGESRLFMWSYAVPALFIFAMTTANLGIAVRQKWMFVPMFIFLFISVIGRRRSNALQLRHVDVSPGLNRHVMRS